MFDAVKVKNDCVDWIRQFFADNGQISWNADNNNRRNQFPGQR